MLIGPVFTREVVTSPRRMGMYVTRATYVVVLLLLMSTAWLVLTGTQIVRDVGDLARFGTMLFSILAPLQLTLAVFFSGLLAASAVAQEKDRRTLILLLLTNLSNSELVLGKLLASLLQMFVLLAAAVPVFMFAALMGGISYAQIGRVFAVTVASMLLCGSLGSTLALWREKTFQSLAFTVLILVLWLSVGELIARGAFGEAWLGVATTTWAIGLSPWQAIVEAAGPFAEPDPALGILGSPVNLFLVVAAAAAVVLNLVAVAMVRVWNPSRETFPASEEEEEGKESIFGVEHDLAASTASAGGAKGAGATDPTVEAGATDPSLLPYAGFGGERLRQQAASVHAAPGRTRHVWNNPILWREVKTWAYGRKVLAIRLVYFVLFALAAVMLGGMVRGGEPLTFATGSLALAPLFLLSLVLVNAQAVTSVTGERDVKALDLLLVTDLSAKEIVFGKIGGVFFNTKEMVILPMALCGYLWMGGVMTLENALYLIGALAVLFVFAAMLGLHAGMHYANSRGAIGVSLGTLFFLFVGVLTCMRMMLAFSGTFEAQLQPFLAFMVGGGVGLYVAIGARNPSTAIGVASFLCPFATFYAITSLLMEQTLGVFLVIVATYGFTTAAMLIPAIYEFDVATGRVSFEE